MCCPKPGIGAVILTNSDGRAMLAPFLRRLLEIVYDGRPKRWGMSPRPPPRIKAQASARRERLTLPGDPAVLPGWRGDTATRRSGELTIRVEDGAKW